MRVKLHWYFFREIPEISWRSAPLWSVFSLIAWRSPYAAGPATTIRNDGLWTLECTRSPQGHTVPFHCPCASPICGFEQIMAVMVALKGRVCLSTPSKTLNSLGNGLEAVFALVPWEEGSVAQPQPGHQELSPEAKNRTRWKEREEKWTSTECKS